MNVCVFLCHLNTVIAVKDITKTSLLVIYFLHLSFISLGVELILCVIQGTNYTVDPWPKAQHNLSKHKAEVGIWKTSVGAGLGTNLLSDRLWCHAGERTKWRKTKGNREKHVFYEWTCRTSSQGKKKTRTAIFDPSQVDKWPWTFQFPVTLFLSLLSSIVWH